MNNEELLNFIKWYFKDMLLEHIEKIQKDREILSDFPKFEEVFGKLDCVREWLENERQK